MFKNPLIPLISVVVLASFAGCTPKQARKGKNLEPQVAQTEPVKAAEAAADRVETEPETTEPNETMTVSTEPEETVPQDNQPVESQPEESVEDTPDTVTREIDIEQPEYAPEQQQTQPEQILVVEGDEPNDAPADETLIEGGQTEPVADEPDVAETVEVEPNEPAAEDAGDRGQGVTRLGDARGADVTVESNELNEPNEVDANDPAVPAVEPDDSNGVDANDVPVATVEPNEPDGVEPNDVTVPAVEPNQPDANDVTVDVVEPDKPDPNATAVPEANDVEPQHKVAFHEKFAWVFEDYVKFSGLVDYDTLTRKQPQLKALLRQLGDLDRKEYESWSRADKIAFWINAYNLKMIHVITENYPIRPKSRIRILWWGKDDIRHIGLEDIKKKKFLVMDEEFTLKRIEDEFFRKQFKDPRIFLAISQGCVSGPPLSKKPYRGETLDKQLESQVRRFLLNNDLAFKLDRGGRKVYISSFLGDNKDMYGSEFLDKYAIDRKFRDQDPATRAVLNFLSVYLPEDVVSFLETGNYVVDYMVINWTVNAAP